MRSAFLRCQPHVHTTYVSDLWHAARVRSGRLFSPKTRRLRSESRFYWRRCPSAMVSATPWLHLVGFRSYSLRCDGFRRGLLANVGPRRCLVIYVLMVATGRFLAKHMYIRFTFSLALGTLGFSVMLSFHSGLLPCNTFL